MPRLKLSAVSLLRIGPLRHDQRPGDERRRLARPAGLDRQARRDRCRAPSARSPGRARSPTVFGFIAITVLRSGSSSSASRQPPGGSGWRRKASVSPTSRNCCGSRSMPQAHALDRAEEIDQHRHRVAPAVRRRPRSRTAPPARPRRAAASGSRSSRAPARPAARHATSRPAVSSRAMKSRSER